MGKESRKSGSLGTQNRTCLLIAGMHRSGTSALTKVLSLAGADLPRTLMQGGANNNASNPTGHWESQIAASLGDRILDSAGIDWRSPESVSPEWYRSFRYRECLDQAVEMLDSEFGQSPLFVFKDPRSCLLLPLWLDAFDRIGTDVRVISIIRNPLEVAGSLHARNGLGLALGQLLWLRYILDAEFASRGTARQFVTYDGLLADPGQIVSSLGKKLDIVWPRQSTQADMAIASFISDKHRHQRQAEPTQAPHSRGFSKVLSEVYGIVSGWAWSDEAEADRETLDRARNSLDNALSLLGEPVRLAFDYGSTVRRMETRERERSQELKAAEELAAEMTRAFEKSRGEVETQRDRLESLSKERDAIVDKLTRALEKSRGEVETQRDWFESLRKERDDIAYKHANAAFSLLRVETMLASAEATNTELKRKIDDGRERFNELEERSSQLDSLLAQKSMLATERQAEIEHLRSDRAARLAVRDKNINKLNRKIADLQTMLAIRERELFKSKAQPALVKRFSRIFRLPRLGASAKRAELLALLRESELFDAAWYLTKYDDVRIDGMDPAAHYLDHGGMEGRWPSPKFDGIWYLENNPDVREANANPLIHYLQHGMIEGRDRRSMDDAVAEASQADGPGLTVQKRKLAAGSSHRRFLPPPDDASNVRTEQSPAENIPAAPWSGRRLSFLALANPSLEVGRKPDQPGASPHDALPTFSEGISCKHANAAIACFDAILLSGKDGPLIINDMPLDQALRNELCDGTVRLADGWLQSPRELTIRLKRSGPERCLMAQCYQYAADQRLIHCGVSQLSAGEHTLVHAQLDHPYRPLLLVVTDINHLLVDSVLIPFPSLLRGGTHHGEIACQPEITSSFNATCQTAQDLLEKVRRVRNGDRSYALSRLVIDLDQAIGTESGLDDDLIDWMANDLGIDLGTTASDETADGARSIEARLSAIRSSGEQRPTAATLHLAADQIVSLQSIFALDGQLAGNRWSVIHIDPYEGWPIFRTSGTVLPGSGSQWKVGRSLLPPIVEGAALEVDCGDVPLTIRWPRTDATTNHLMALGAQARLPFTAGSSQQLSVLVDCPDEMSSLAPILSSIEELATDFLIDCTFLAGPSTYTTLAEALDGTLIAGVNLQVRHSERATPLARFREASLQCRSDQVLLLDQTVVLHDKRIGVALMAALNLPGVGAVTGLICSEFSDSKNNKRIQRSAGWIATPSDNGLIMANVDLGDCPLPPLFGIFAPDLRCTMIDRTKLMELPDATDAIDFGQGLSANAFVCLALSFLTASAEFAPTDPSVITVTDAPLGILHVEKLLR